MLDMPKQEVRGILREYRDEWIGAMEGLLTWYQYMDRDTWDELCPLCTVAQEYVNALEPDDERFTRINDECQGTCTFCVWNYFTEIGCEDFYEKFKWAKGTCVAGTRDSCPNYPEWREMRIKQLRMWIKNMKRWV